MARIVYRKVNGRAGDIRFAGEGYALKADELELDADVLPDAASLSDAAVVQADTEDEQRRAIDAARDAALLEGVLWNGRMWHTDERFQLHLAGFASAWTNGLLPAEATVNVRAMDNTTHPLTRAELLALSAAVMMKVQTVWAESWAAKDALG